MKIGLFIILFIWSYSAQGLRGDDVNNGGGLAEKNILFAYRSLENSLNFCLQTKWCQLTQIENSLLENIRSGLSEEYKNQTQIQFKSEKEDPGFFIIDGSLKVAKTGSSVGSVIFFNLDLLYLENSFGKIEPMGLAGAVNHLVHELGHHTGDWAHEALDLLGAKVSLAMNHYMMKTPLLPHTTDMSLTVMNSLRSRGHPSVLLYVFGEFFDLTRDFKNILICHAGSIPILKTKRPYGATLHNLHWQHFSTTTQSGSYSIKGNISMFCKKNATLATNEKDYHLILKFKLRKRSPDSENSYRWEYQPDSIRLKMVYDPWWKVVKVPIIDF